MLLISKEKMMPVKQLFTGLLLAISLNALSQVKTGQPAPEISLPDAKGNTLSLSSLKGKVVLIDFWASWCNPCRLNNPNVVKLYAKYKAKGFEVFAVSIDSKKSAWLKAVKQDRLTYIQVNDNAGWSAPSVAAYGVEAIPTTFLLNKEGVIVAIDAEGKELENKIKQLLE